MKTKLFISAIAILSIALFSSCEENSSNNLTDLEPGFGAISGTVNVFDSLGVEVSDKSGVIVKLSMHNSDFSSTTDIDGNWIIEDVPAAVYTAMIYKDGIDTVLVDDFQFVGNGELKIGNKTLRKDLSIDVLDIKFSDANVQKINSMMYKVSFNLNITISSPAQFTAIVLLDNNNFPTFNNNIFDFSVQCVNGLGNRTVSMELHSSEFDPNNVVYYFTGCVEYSPRKFGIFSTPQQITFTKDY